MKKPILFTFFFLLLIISCGRDDNNDADDNSNSTQLENTNWFGVFSSSDMEIMTNNIINRDNEKVQIQFKDNSTFKLYGYGKNTNNQWIVNSGPYKGSYTHSSNGTIKLNYEFGATFSPLNNGSISGSVMTLKVGDKQFKFNKE